MACDKAERRLRSGGENEVVSWVYDWKIEGENFGVWTATSRRSFFEHRISL